jgi:hypothetical protein
MNICAPAILYLAISALSIIYFIFTETYNLLFYVFNILMIVLWTWILNVICNAGYKWVSWVLVLFPFIILFLLIFVDFVSLVVNDVRKARASRITPTMFR